MRNTEIEILVKVESSCSVSHQYSGRPSASFLWVECLRKQVEINDFFFKGISLFYLTFLSCKPQHVTSLRSPGTKLRPPSCLFFERRAFSLPGRGGLLGLRSGCVPRLPGLWFTRFLALHQVGLTQSHKGNSANRHRRYGRKKDDRGIILD